MDISHFMGGDLSISASGDLASVTGKDEGTQRLLRRLTTNLGDYLWHLDYGAGLPAKVGSIADQREIQGLIRSQIFLESFVAKTPEPVIEVKPISNGISVSIKYTDAVTQKVTSLSFDVKV